MTNDLWSVAVAAALCALGGWIGDAAWAALIGGAIGGTILALGTAVQKAAPKE